MLKRLAWVPPWWHFDFKGKSNKGTLKDLHRRENVFAALLLHPRTRFLNAAACDDAGVAL